jgi:molybdopterin molybdotransferase
MIGYTEALEILDAEEIRLGGETVKLCDAQGRLLSDAVYSPCDLPLFDTARMDGYAVSEGEDAECLEVLGTLAAGEVADTALRLRPGGCIRIMTGAPVPEGTARIIPREEVEEQPSQIRIRHADEAAHITPAGSYLGRGDLLVPRKRLGPADIGALAWAGIAELEVAARIPAAVLSTGDELRLAGTELRRGEIYDAVGPLLEARLRQVGAEVVGRRLVADDPQELKRSIGGALEEARLLLLSGGVSRGDYDYTAAALEACGVRTLFHRVAIKPGRPLLFGVKREAQGPDRYVFALPGNPVSAFLDHILFTERLLRSSAGLSPEPPGLYAPLAQRLAPSDPGRSEFFPVRFAGGAIEPIGYRDSGNIAGFAAADGIVQLSAGAAPMERKELVYVRPL